MGDAAVNLPLWNDLPQAIRTKVMSEAVSLGCAPCCSEAMRDTALTIYEVIREELAEAYRLERQTKAYADLFREAGQ